MRSLGSRRSSRTRWGSWDVGGVLALVPCSVSCWAFIPAVCDACLEARWVSSKSIESCFTACKWNKYKLHLTLFSVFENPNLLTQSRVKTLLCIKEHPSQTDVRASRYSLGLYSGAAAGAGCWPGLVEGLHDLRSRRAALHHWMEIGAMQYLMRNAKREMAVSTIKHDTGWNNVRDNPTKSIRSASRGDGRSTT